MSLDHKVLVYGEHGELKGTYRTTRDGLDDLLEDVYFDDPYATRCVVTKTVHVATYKKGVYEEYEDADPEDE